MDVLRLRSEKFHISRCLTIGFTRSSIETFILPMDEVFVKWILGLPCVRRSLAKSASLNLPSAPTPRENAVPFPP